MVFYKKKGNDQELIISRPKPPISTIGLVVLRTSTVLYLLMSAILTHMAVIHRPWKQEWFGSDSKTLEISIWHVCRATVKGSKCYEGEYDDAPGWFLSFRWFLMLSVFLQYICVLFIMAKMTFTKNAGSRYFWVPAFLCLTSAILILIAMLMLIGYREFDFLEESRMFRMGWRFEEIDIEERWGWPYYLTWCNFAICLLGFFLCIYTHLRDAKWAKFFAVEGLKRQAQQLMR